MLSPQHSTTLQMIASDLQRYPLESYRVACASIIANCVRNGTSLFAERANSAHLLRWTLTQIVSLLPAEARKDDSVIELLEAATRLTVGS